MGEMLKGIEPISSVTNKIIHENMYEDEQYRSIYNESTTAYSNEMGFDIVINVCNVEIRYVYAYNSCNAVCHTIPLFV